MFGVVAPVTDYPVDVFERVMAVNVTGSFLVAKHALAAMQPGGKFLLHIALLQGIERRQFGELSGGQKQRVLFALAIVLIFAGTVLNQTHAAVQVMGITMAVYLAISLLIALALNVFNARYALKER